MAVGVGDGVGVLVGTAVKVGATVGVAVGNSRATMATGDGSEDSASDWQATSVKQNKDNIINSEKSEGSLGTVVNLTLILH